MYAFPLKGPIGPLPPSLPPSLSPSLPPSLPPSDSFLPSFLSFFLIFLLLCASLSLSSLSLCISICVSSRSCDRSLSLSLSLHVSFLFYVLSFLEDCFCSLPPLYSVLVSLSLSMSPSRYLSLSTVFLRYRLTCWRIAYYVSSLLFVQNLLCFLFQCARCFLHVLA